MQIEDTVAVVTGAGSGLGRATAIALAAAGSRIVCLDRNGAAAEATAGRIGELGAAEALAVEADVADESSVDAAFAEIATVHRAVHICVNAAGIAPAGKIVGRRGPLPLADFRKVIGVNLVGLFDVTRRCAALMAGNRPGPDGERGVIVNVSSGAAWQGQKGQAAYAASKAGVIGLMLPVARDLYEYGVRVVTIAPGIFETGMSAAFSPELLASLEQMVLNPKRLGRPEEFASLVQQVVTNGYLNAVTLPLDGGARIT